MSQLTNAQTGSLRGAALNYAVARHRGELVAPQNWHLFDYAHAVEAGKVLGGLTISHVAHSHAHAVTIAASGAKPMASCPGDTYFEAALRAYLVQQIGPIASIPLVMADCAPRAMGLARFACQATDVAAGELCELREVRCGMDRWVKTRAARGAAYSPNPPNPFRVVEVTPDDLAQWVRQAQEQRAHKCMAELDFLWNILGDLPTNDDGAIEMPFLDFPRGTPRETVWHWFESQNPAFSVAQHMGLADAPDRQRNGDTARSC